MPLAKLEAELRPIARERIHSGQLPCQSGTMKMWGGHGSGAQTCALCDKKILSSELELEVEEPGTAGGAPARMFFHVVCQSIWQLECARAEYSKHHS
jgi:hypothetical protein